MQMTGDCEKDFSIRLTQLRQQRDVSAREMSLAIGQNAGYINNIETGKAFPSMSLFFAICEYLGITPKEFFDFGKSNPKRQAETELDLTRLNDEQLEHIGYIVRQLVK